MNSKLKNFERLQIKQQRADSGLMSERYPNVASVIVAMNYYNNGSDGQVIMQRTVNFFPSSNTYFKMECMKHDCIDGGFNLETVIAKIMKDHLKSGKGELVCAGKDSSCHARIDYKISIKYKDTSH